MKNPDDAIDRALAALREAKPPEGMEHRILQTVQHHSPERRSGWKPITLRLPLPLTGVQYRGIALACLAAALSATFYILSKPPARSHGTAAILNHSTQANAVAHSPSREANPKIARSVTAVPVQTSPRRARSTRREMRATLQEIRFENHPAPEVPLTGQEKLLLRLAHRRDPQEIAALNPSLWAARDAKEKEEVKSFFEPPPGDDQ